MKTIDVELEEEILALMLQGEDFAKLGSRELVNEDFVAEHDNIYPRDFTRQVFDRIRHNVVHSGGSGSYKTVQRSFLADPSIKEKNQKAFADLVGRLHRQSVERNLGYLQQCVQQLKLTTRRRNQDEFARALKEKTAKDDLLGFEEVAIEYTRGTTRFRGHQDPVVIDYKENYRERVQEAQSAVVDDMIRVAFRPIDDNFGAISRGELLIWVARTSGGKSVVKQHISANAVQLGSPVLYITKEDTEKQVAFRFDSHFTGIDQPRFHKRALEEDDFKMWGRTIDDLPDNMLRIARMGPTFTVEEIEGVYKQQYNAGFVPSLVVVDYINIMKPSSGSTYFADYKAVDIVVQELKEFALEYNVGLMTSAQLRPEFYNETKLTVEMIAASKLGISTNADGLFGLIVTDEMKAMNQAKIQVMKCRSAGIATEFYNIEPNLNQITMHKKWRIGKGKRVA